MKSLKEIETKISKILILDAGAWGARAHTQAKEARLLIKEDAQNYQGWLVGLGRAYGIFESMEWWRATTNIRNKILKMNPKTPYEQGKKEALEWCLK